MYNVGLLEVYAIMNRKNRAIEIITLLKQYTSAMEPPMVSVLINKFGRDPFIVLIGCLLSLRSKDIATLPICIELFTQARLPQDILAMSIESLEKMFYTLGFYKKKSHLLHYVCRDLINRFDGNVPSDETALLSIKGVGRKTANLVLGEGFGIPSICVDTHVHRISNRLGLVSTQTPAETETELKLILPRNYWIEWNRLIVMWGQNVCVPISPWCSRCALCDKCERVSVTVFR